MANSRHSRLGALLVLLMAGLTAGMIAVTQRLLRRYAIAEHSMQPSLNPGDWVLADRVTGSLRRGDIVVFGHPQRPELDLIKRVIGLPGESITIIAGTVRIDGRGADQWAAGSTLPDGSWQLGPSEVFVLGDNRALSGDSRALGPIPVAAIGWKVWCRYRPLPVRRDL